MRRFSLTLVLAGLPLLLAPGVHGQVGDNRDQFEAQREGRYIYTPYSAMGSPVVLPMDGVLDQTDWLTGLDVNFAGIFFPHLHVDTAVGSSTGEPRDLQLGHHDPNKNGFTWQSIEFGLSGRFNEHFETYGVYAANVDSEGHWNGIYEEWFAKLHNIELGGLGGFEVRGGRIYNRFGIQNTYHPHGFDWVDQYLVNARILGEDSMTIIGTDLTWKLPVKWTSQLDVALGVAPGGHEGHDDHRSREFEGAEFEAEAALFNDFMTVANWTNVYNYNDFHQFRAGGSGAWGDNEYELGTGIYGVHFEYQWRENGFLPGGRHFRWRNEAMWRRWNADSSRLTHDDHDDDHDDHHDDHDDHDDDHDEVLRASLGEFGFYSSVLYGFNPRFEVGLRAEYVNGNPLAGLDDRFRMSPAATWYVNDARSARFRVQYNYDVSRQFGTDHSVWGQLSLTWGGPEVR